MDAHDNSMMTYTGRTHQRANSTIRDNVIAASGSFNVQAMPFGGHNTMQTRIHDEENNVTMNQNMVNTTQNDFVN